MKNLDIVSAIHQLKQITRLNIAEIKKPLSFWKRAIEGILAVASSLGWCQPSRRVKAVATLEAIRRQGHQIVRGSEPNNSKMIVESVTPKIINSIVTDCDRWLKELDIQTKQQLQLLEKDLNKLEEWLSEIQPQIFKTQKELTAARQDVEINANSVNKLLHNLLQMPQIPIQLKDLASEYLQNQAKITIEASKLSPQINYWQNCIARLEALTASFNPSEILLGTKTKINNELETQKKIIFKSNRESQQFEQQIKQVKAQLQQHLDNREQS